ncbi:hypothetical protein H5410_040488 [Solanum commersonii]|uniref:Uncharacterized protein n=1 Tax=Solanum commersonii TaxID=4109 RepID=A0A9J5XSN1_SOLCO|nr:hypothetical protein H5410_040488 [Solanum commersonii]
MLQTQVLENVSKPKGARGVSLEKRSPASEALDDDHHGMLSSPQAVKASVGEMLAMVAMVATAKPLRAPGRVIFFPTGHQGLHGRDSYEAGLGGAYHEPSNKLWSPSRPVKGSVKGSMVQFWLVSSSLALFLAFSKSKVLH